MSYTVWRTFEGHRSIVNFVTFSGSGELLATGGTDLLHNPFLTEPQAQMTEGRSLYGLLCQTNSSKSCLADLRKPYAAAGATTRNYSSDTVMAKSITSSITVSPIGSKATPKSEPAGRAITYLALLCMGIGWLPAPAIPFTAGLFKVQHPFGHTGAVEAALAAGEAALSSDSKYLSITTLACAVAIYEIIPTGLRAFREFASPIAAMNNFPMQTCFSEFQNFVVTGSDDGQVRLWNMRTGQKTVLKHDGFALILGLSLPRKRMRRGTKITPCQNMAAKLSGFSADF
ncbi:hypothetical protein AURDEDRAFT_121875 [Auricularia subglabra TFB-10046 SS5]|nr:hypothetical protein AURDEDRAFT_121875 [Auricularia subglabra TFB-10046 SS5]